MTSEREALLPCPFCGGRDISEGEVLTEHPNGRTVKQNQCGGCGALGPEAEVDGPDYGDVRSNAAWNRRAHISQPAQAVDVVKVRELVRAWREREARDSAASGEYYSGRSHGYEACADELEAALTPKDSRQMLNEDVKEAFDRFEATVYRRSDWLTIRAHLEAQEAEIERLRNVADGNAELYQHELLRTQKAEALLRECRLMLPAPCTPLEAAIAAHLQEQEKGNG